MCLSIAVMHPCAAQESAFRMQLVANRLLEPTDTEMILFPNSPPGSLSTGEKISMISVAYFMDHAEERIKLEANGQSAPPLSKAQQDSLNTGWLSYLGRLRSVGLVYPVAYRADSIDIMTGNYRYLDEILGPISLRQMQLDFWGPGQLSVVLDSLLSSGAMRQQDHDKLLKESRAYRITTIAQLLPYLQHGLSVNMRDYKDPDTSTYALHIYRDISRLLPELSFGNFKYDIDRQHYWGLSSDKHPVSVSLRANGRSYSEDGAIYINNRDSDAFFFNSRIDVDGICPLFNRVLADVRSPYRLAVVSKVLGSKYDTAYDPARFTIMAITPRQYQVFEVLKDYFDVSMTTFESNVTLSEVKKALDTISQIGLLNHLTADQSRLARAAALDTSVPDIVSVLHFFPDLMYTFDVVQRPKDGPYGPLLHHLRALSHGAFACDTATYDFSKTFRDTIGVSFSVNGTKYHREFRNSNGYFERKFFTLINEAVAGAGLPGQFYRIASYPLHMFGYDPRSYLILYLTPAQKARLESNQFCTLVRLE